MGQEAVTALLISVGVHPTSAEFVGDLVARGDAETAQKYLRSRYEAE